jgi:Zn-dependent metalloprotease
VWWDALTSDAVGSSIDFAGFAGVTVDAARARFGDGSTEHTAVQDAWRQVGVLG